MQETHYKVQELVGSLSKTWKEITYKLPLGMARQIYKKHLEDNPDCKFRIIKVTETVIEPKE